MWYCFHEQDIGIDNFEGQGSANNNLHELRTGKSGLIYVIYMKVKKSQALNAAILRGLHFTSSHKTMENNETQSPTNTCMKKAVQRFVMTFSSGHMPGILSLPCTVAFIATHW